MGEIEPAASFGALSATLAMAKAAMTADLPPKRGRWPVGQRGRCPANDSALARRQNIPYQQAAAAPHTGPCSRFGELASRLPRLLLFFPVSLAPLRAVREPGRADERTP